MRNIWEKDLGEELFLSYAEILNQALAPLDDILTDAESVWFRDTPRKEVLATSLREAQAELTKQQGPDPAAWSWGRLHTLTLAHASRKQQMAGAVLLARPLPRRTATASPPTTPTTATPTPTTKR